MGLFEKFIPKKKETEKEEEKAAGRLKGIPVKYIYVIIGTIASVLIGLLVGGGDSDNNNGVADAVTIAQSMSEELYQRKTVSLDEIEMLAGGRREKILSDSKDKRYKKGDYVGNDESLNTPINIFSDPRYAVSKSYETSSGRTGLSFNIPAGTILRAYLENEVSTAGENIPVVGVIYYASSDNGSKYLPEGSKIIGKIRDVTGNRASVEFRGGLMPDGTRFRITGIAISEEYGSRFQGIAGIVDNRVGRRGGSMIASSALRATRTLTRMTGGSWGSIFAGEMADQTMDGFEDGIDRGLDTYDGPEVILPANTRFMVVVR